MIQVRLRWVHDSAVRIVILPVNLGVLVLARVLGLWHRVFGLDVGLRGTGVRGLRRGLHSTPEIRAGV